jgi:hypothetical protein
LEQFGKNAEDLFTVIAWAIMAFTISTILIIMSKATWYWIFVTMQTTTKALATLFSVFCQMRNKTRPVVCDYPLNSFLGLLSFHL